MFARVAGSGVGVWEEERERERERVACDSEIVLPLTASSGQVSTAALQMTSQPCLAVKRPSALMKKSRVSNGSTRSRGTTLKTSQAQHTSSRLHDSSLLFNKLSTPSAVPSCITHPPLQLLRQKVLVLSSWLLFGRPGTNASDSNCSHFLEALLDLFLSEDWSALWSMVRAECDVAPISRGSHQFSSQAQTISCPHGCHTCPIR